MPSEVLTGYWYRPWIAGECAQALDTLSELRQKEDQLHLGQLAAIDELQRRLDEINEQCAGHRVDMTMIWESPAVWREIFTGAHFYEKCIGHRHNAIHLHGHSHATEEAELEREIAALLHMRGVRTEIYNVGCMYWNYEPVTLDKILRGNTARPAPHDDLPDKFSL